MRNESLDSKQQRILTKMQELIRLHNLVLESQKRIEKLMTQLPLESLNDDFMRLQGKKRYNVRDMKLLLDKCTKCSIAIAGEWAFRRSIENPNFCSDCAGSI